MMLLHSVTRRESHHRTVDQDELVDLGRDRRLVRAKLPPHPHQHVGHDLPVVAHMW